MRIYSLMIVLLMSSLVFTGCGDDDDDDEPAGGNSLTVDGNDASSVNTTASDIQGGGTNSRQIVINDPDGGQIIIGINGAETAETQEYTFGQQTTVSLTYTDANNSTFLANSGSLTLTTNSESDVAGSFNADAISAAGGNNVSVSGSFETSVD